MNASNRLKRGRPVVCKTPGGHTPRGGGVGIKIDKKEGVIFVPQIVSLKVRKFLYTESKATPVKRIKEQ
jgi:hypothetical protein